MTDNPSPVCGWRTRVLVLVVDKCAVVADVARYGKRRDRRLLGAADLRSPERECQMRRRLWCGCGRDDVVEIVALDARGRSDQLEALVANDVVLKTAESA